MILIILSALGHLYIMYILLHATLHNCRYNLHLNSGICIHTYTCNLHYTRWSNLRGENYFLFFWLLRPLRMGCKRTKLNTLTPWQKMYYLHVVIRITVNGSLHLVNFQFLEYETILLLAIHLFNNSIISETFIQSL